MTRNSRRRQRWYTSRPSSAKVPAVQVTRMAPSKSDRYKAVPNNTFRCAKSAKNISVTLNCWCASSWTCAFGFPSRSSPGKAGLGEVILNPFMHFAESNFEAWKPASALENLMT